MTNRREMQVRIPDAWDIYCRLSKDRWGNFIAVGRQEKDCRAAAARDKVNVGNIHVDNNLSAWKRNRKRPGWDALLERIRTGKIGGAYAYHDDRLIRHPADAELFLAAVDRCYDDRRFWVRLVLDGKLFDLSDEEVRNQLRQRTLYASNEVAAISRRVNRALRENREMGILPGYHKAFGYEARDSVPIPEQAAVIREVAERLLDLGHTWTVIANDLNERGITSGRGKPWNRSNLRTMMGNKRHGGMTEWEDAEGNAKRTLAPRPERTPDGEPWPVLETAVFDRLQAWLSASRRGRMRTTLTLCSGWAKCGKCNIPMVGSTNTGKTSRMPDGSVRRSYRCPKDRGGCSMAVTADYVDDMVREVTIAWFAQRAPELEQAADVYDAELAQAVRHAEQISTSYADMYAKLAKKGLNPDIIDAACADVDRALDKAWQRVHELERDDQRVTRVAGNVAERWDDPATPITEKRTMMQQAIKSLVIQPAKPRGLGRFDTDRVQIEAR